MKTNWPTKKLKDLLEFFDAGVWGKPAPEGKGLLILRSTNITNEGSLDFSDVAELDIQDKIGKLKLLDGDILLEKSGGGPDQPVGRVAYFVAPNHRIYSFANFIQRLRTKSDLIDSSFLFYRLLLLHKTGFTKKLQSQTTGIRNLKLSLYLKTEIPLPPLEIQKQIVERLDAVRKAQNLNGKQISLTDELFQALLHKELDSANRNWEVKKLGELVEFLDHMCKPVNDEERQKRVGPYPYYGANGQVGWIDDYIFDEDLVLLAEDGGYFGSKDRPIAYRISGKTWVNNHAHVLKPITKLVDIDFIYFSLMFYDITSYITGSTRAKLNKSSAERIKIPLPPLKIQKQIVEKLSAVQEYKKKLLRQKELLQELFESTLDKAMKGELVK